MGANCSNITYPDQNLTAYVYDNMGPRCLDNKVAVVTAVFYSLILLLGSFGNLFTCVVIWRNACMHKATNYYLFSLAVSDLISLLLGLPFELARTMTSTWPDILPEPVCKLRSFLTETTSYASALTITAFSIERWLAICFPLKVHIRSKFNRAVKVILAVWVTACTSALPIAVFARLDRIPLPDQLLSSLNVVVDNRSTTGVDRRSDANRSTAQLLIAAVSDDGFTIRHTDICALDSTRPVVTTFLLNFSFYCFFLLPFLTICCLYAHIGITIIRQTKLQKAINDASKHDAKTFRRRVSVIKMLVAVVLAFFTCWLPFHLQRLCSLYFDPTSLSAETVDFFHTIFFVSGYFYYANAAVNPVLYNALNARYRRAFLETLYSCVKRARPSSQHEVLDVSGLRSSISNVGMNHSKLISISQACGLSAVAGSAPLLTSGYGQCNKDRKLMDKSLARRSSNISAMSSSSAMGDERRSQMSNRRQEAKNGALLGPGSAANCRMGRLRKPKS